MVTVPEVNNFIYVDEEETNENNVEDHKSPSKSAHLRDHPKGDDDDAPTPGAGGDSQPKNASVTQKKSDKKSHNSPPSSPHKSSHPLPNSITLLLK